MALKLNSSGGGSVTIDPVSTASNVTITIPATTGGSVVVADSSGNVGIGTTSPSSLLDLNKTSGAADIRLKVGGTLYGNLYASSSDMTVGSVAAIPLIFGTTNTERMRIDTSGNVTPGVTTTQNLGSASLLWSNVYSNKFVSPNVTSTSLTDGAIILNGTTGAIVLDDAGQKRISWNDGGGNFNIRSGNYFTASTTLLYAKGAADTNGGAATITLSSDSADGAITLSTAAIGVPGAAVTYTGVLTVAPTYVNLDANTGVGVIPSSFATHANTQKNFYVAGSVNLRGGSNTSGRYWAISSENNAGSNLTLYNAAGAGQYMVYGATAWTANSDERLKTTLTPFSNAIEKVSTLRAGTGRYLTDDENVSRSFLIAQDVQQVLPEAVDVQEDDNGTLGLRYTDLIPLLTTAIQEQQALIVSLTARISALENT